MRLLPTLLLLSLISSLISCQPKYSVQENNEIVYLINENGPTLGYSVNSGVKLVESSRFAFKDLNKNGHLDPYEDWRLSADERAKYLISKMSVEQMAGLMLYSGHQAIPVLVQGRYGGTYNGKVFSESGMQASDLTDQQKIFLTDDHLRHVLITSVESPAVAAQWNNNAQALVEGIGLGIPINISSDPRHGSDSYAEYNAGAGGKISMWPSTLGLAATFDPEIMKEFGEVASQEYRALGIATALSPQIDLGTEPRWSRFDGTMGEDPELTTDMARAYVDGFQTSYGEDEIQNGWGMTSVNAMVKHWPGGGPEEGGRDAHYGYGAYAVYPGNNLKDHLKPFTEGAFKLKGGTQMASAVMPYYTISFDQDKVNDDKVGNSYNKYLITDLLREKYQYDGVVCTDWMITADAHSVDAFEGKCWGVEKLSVAERHFKAIEAGVDQFGGNNEMGPVLEAYQMGVDKFGEEAMRKRFEASALRLLRNVFRVGLFENPYLDVEKTQEVVGNPDFMKKGYDAQLKSVVMLKNKAQTLPIKERLKVYVPMRYTPGGVNWFGMAYPEKNEYPFNMDKVKEYYDVVDDPKEADFALVGIRNPDGGAGYDKNDLTKGGNGYVPVSLQYNDYTATYAREQSIAGGSPFEDFENRSYKGKTVKTNNVFDYYMVRDTKKAMGNKPVIVIVHASKPMVMSEIEPLADGILMHMGVQHQAILDILSGKTAPSGLLPFQLPENMKTVEEQFEDKAHDMKCYTDSEGNTYDFGYGLNFSGVINDDRVSRYRK
ncbi:glycoside hydrolase family 3 N-terminal domain-containing protein [Carboxylicivirga caseinilyticus]|uniref:glycoside hydrolase family 3 protein n=1 Tax=Carboxylicivirga caseinilyticus TaxID=3417572 RepID=UPI003D34B7E9|nr:glycoside hydrolase family 3 C-terminal domain-containing protein [Marinilabiliaceae bacterium A049]